MIDIYPVGTLAAWRRSIRGIRLGIRHPLAPLCSEVRYVARCIRRGKWRAAKNASNGYLAEPDPLPIGLQRVGSGWTKGRALRRLQREVRRIELP